MKTTEELKVFCQEVSQQEGFILYDLVLGGRGKKNQFLRLSIDHKERPVTVEDCSRVSKALRWLLGMKNILDIENYDLEVSSPGLERVLKEVWHYEKAIGETIRLQLKKGYKSKYKNGKILLKGLLKKVNQEGLFLRFQNKGGFEDEFFPFERIQRAHIFFDGFLKKKEKNQWIKKKKQKKKQTKKVSELRGKR